VTCYTQPCKPCKVTYILHYLPQGGESSPRGGWGICAPALPKVLTQLVLITITAVGSLGACIYVVIWYVLQGSNVFLTRYTALDRSIPVAVLLVLDVCGVMCGVFSVLPLSFCSTICFLCGDLSLLGFYRAMFVDKK
jgi:hypothetical protein